MSYELESLLSGELLDENVELTLAQLCRACQLPAEEIIHLVEQGVIDPLGRDPSHWRFYGVCVRRIRIVQRLEQDLGVNVAGAALALELFEELEQLRNRLRRFEE